MAEPQSENLAYKPIKELPVDKFTIDYELQDKLRAIRTNPLAEPGVEPRNLVGLGERIVSFIGTEADLIKVIEDCQQEPVKEVDGQSVAYKFDGKPIVLRRTGLDAIVALPVDSEEKSDYLTPEQPNTIYLREEIVGVAKDEKGGIAALILMPGPSRGMVLAEPRDFPKGQWEEDGGPKYGSVDRWQKVWENPWIDSEHLHRDLNQGARVRLTYSTGHGYHGNEERYTLFVHNYQPTLEQKIYPKSGAVLPLGVHNWPGENKFVPPSIVVPLDAAQKIE